MAGILRTVAAATRTPLVAAAPLAPGALPAGGGTTRAACVTWLERCGLTSAQRAHFFSKSTSAKPEENEKASTGAAAAEGEAAAAAPGDSAEEAEGELSDVERLEAALAEKDEELKELNDRLLRSFAEMENVRTRMTKQADDAKKFALQGFAKDLLDVADNMRRAAEGVPAPEAGADMDAAAALKALKTLQEGVKLTEDSMHQVFRRNGLSRFDPPSLGAQFDPNTMMALFEMPEPSKESGIVGAVIKEGYMLHGRVVRPAEVGVVKNA